MQVAKCTVFPSKVVLIRKLYRIRNWLKNPSSGFGEKCFWRLRLLFELFQLISVSIETIKSKHFLWIELSETKHFRFRFWESKSSWWIWRKTTSGLQKKLKLNGHFDSFACHGFDTISKIRFWNWKTLWKRKVVNRNFCCSISAGSAGENWFRIRINQCCLNSSAFTFLKWCFSCFETEKDKLRLLELICFW